MMKTRPAVFAVGKDYQIMVPVSKPSLMWVKVGDKNYYDESNGIMRSDVAIHRMTVPSDELDREKKYTVCEREIIDRKPYFAETEDEVRTEFAFSPVPDDGIRIYHIADVHNHPDAAILAAKGYGDIDLLVLNGDIPNHSGTADNFTTVYELCDAITGGSKPVVFARGNHDLRGSCAEHFADYTPQKDGRTYYTFRLGSIWGIVLDCGEDKDDSHPEYGLTVACHPFRERETGFIKDVISDADNEYGADGVKYRLVIAHNPFPHKMKDPFGIEGEIYSEWCRLLKENVKPDLLLSGHLHYCGLFLPGSQFDAYGAPCPIVVGSDPGRGDTFGKVFKGTGVEFSCGEIKISFTDEKGVTEEMFTL